MEVATASSVLEALADLRRGLEGELEALAEKRTGLERELEALDKDIESKHRMLGLVETTKEQLAAQGRGQPDVEGDGPGASTQVRGSAKLKDLIKPVWPTWGWCPCCDSPRQRLRSSGPVPRRPMSGCRFSLSPPGTSPLRCGRTTCCPC
jgi:hypothetical protein